MVTAEQYLISLRNALRHLYDPAILRASPLLELLALTGHPDPANALHETLIEAIEALEPRADVPAHSRLWRIHEVLLYRYVQQCGQEEVADQLGISVRHLRREEREAARALGFRLARRHQAPVNWHQAEEAPGERAEEPPEPETPPPISNLSWLQDSPPDEFLALERLLPTVLEMVRGMAAQYDVRLQAEVPAELSSITVHRIALRQILLSLLTAAIRQTAGGTVWLDVTASIDATAPQQSARLTLRGQHATRTAEYPADAANLEMAHHLAEICGCALKTSLEQGAFTATLQLPALEQVPVLMVEDHLDTIQLFQRYTFGTSYRVVGVRDVEQVLSLAAQVRPRLILLDVMMPRIDGWEFLGRLRQHPLTSRLPILICTILPQQELALSLGADGFLQKPVSREALLSALDRYLCPAERSPHP